MLWSVLTSNELPVCTCIRCTCWLARQSKVQPVTADYKIKHIIVVCTCIIIADGYGGRYGCNECEFCTAKFGTEYSGQHGVIASGRAWQSRQELPAPQPHHSRLRARPGVGQPGLTVAEYVTSVDESISLVYCHV